MTLERIDVAKMSKLVNMLPEDWCEAQLESDQKEYEVMLVTKNLEIGALRKEHRAAIREIKEGIEKKMERQKCDPDTESYFLPYYWIDEGDWQELWQKWIGK